MEIYKAIGSLLRHGLTLAGGYLVSNGILTEDQSTQVIGAVIALAGVALALYNKRTK